MILVIITAITLFVTGAADLRRSSATTGKRQPASRRALHTTRRSRWRGRSIPIVILVFIGAFSLPVLFKQQEIPEGDITIKVTGYQWYWGYEYVDRRVRL